MASIVIPCPFVYANGKPCAGTIRQARGYGPKQDGHCVDQDTVRKYRLWCSEKDDHAGAVAGLEGKMRMEFILTICPKG